MTRIRTTLAGHEVDLTITNEGSVTVSAVDRSSHALRQGWADVRNYDEWLANGGFLPTADSAS